jgi:hypothetical protein
MQMPHTSGVRYNDGMAQDRAPHQIEGALKTPSFFRTNLKPSEVKQKGVASTQKILLKNPLGRKILDFEGIKSPCLYRKNTSTGILERLLLSREYELFNVRKEAVFQRIYKRQNN